MVTDADIFLGSLGVGHFLMILLFDCPSLDFEKHSPSLPTPFLCDDQEGDPTFPEREYIRSPFKFVTGQSG